MENIQMFCLPYAGGNSSIYHSWNRKVRRGVEVVPIEYKGHGSYLFEDVYHTIEEAITDVLIKITAQVNGDYMIYGHSMGALLAFEVASRISRDKIKKPIKIILAGIRPPHLIKKDKKYTHLSKDDFMRAVYSLGETAKEVFENEELYDVYFDILYSDFKLVEHYQLPEYINNIDIPTIVLAGQTDPEAPKACMLEWKEYVNADFQFHTLPGNHFFTFNEEEAFFKLFNQLI